MKRDCTIYVAKTKALISFAATARLICVFVFAYAKCWFSHDVAQLFCSGTIACIAGNLLFQKLKVFYYPCQDKTKVLIRLQMLRLVCFFAVPICIKQAFL